MEKGKKKLIVGGMIAGGLMLGAAALVVGAGVAKADNDQDMRFIALLDSRNIAANGSEGMAHGVCAGLDLGYTPAQETEAVYVGTPLNHDQAMWFTVASMEVYCPWHDGQHYFESQPVGKLPRMHEMAGYAERGHRK